MTPPERSDMAPAANAAPNWRNSLVPWCLGALKALTLRPLGSTFPLTDRCPGQTTRSAVDFLWMRSAVLPACAQNQVNSRRSLPEALPEAARSGGMCEAPLEVVSILLPPGYGR